MRYNILIRNASKIFRINLFKDMVNLRKYENKPYGIAVIHGGPGAPGEMAPIARELSSIKGVLEPLQTATTIEGQVEELKIILLQNGALPITLIGFSWGAMLSFIFTAKNPSFVNKLILISSGVYEEEYAVNIMGTRLIRLSDEEREEALLISETLNDSSTEDKNTPMAKLGKLIFKADSYNPLPHNSEIIEYQHDIYQSIWEEVMQLRSCGKLLKLGENIKCPVVAIHGDYDPHPFKGVKDPLSRILKDFRFMLLEKCGHYPWVERNAKDRFYDILKNESKMS
ncbi:alpha/beta fold hydrolase [Chloroflexota bacterium]